jgi:hypothetical protein
MAKVSELLKKAEAEIGNTQRSVLLVEGPDDKQAIEAFLNKKNAQWAKAWIVLATGKKSNVLEILTQRPAWLGLVDRDEWSEAVIAEKQQELPNLVVLKRFCIESYLISPDELWQALPPKQQQKITGGLSELEGEILANLDQWVAHGVLWSVINPMWEGLRTLGFKNGLLEFNAANDRDFIVTKLNEWHDYLEPKQIMDQFDQRLQMVRSLSFNDKITQWIHGKKFFASVIDPILNKHLGHLKQGTRQQKIFEHLSVPADLDTLWQKMKV